MGLVYEAAYYLSRAIGHCCFDYRVINRERIPREGSLLMAVNHQSFLDPPLVGCASNRHVFYLARKSLSEIPVLGGILPKLNVIPYNQEGSDMSAIKAVIRVLKAGRATLIFPEGTRSKDGNLLPAQPGTGMIVAKTLSGSANADFWCSRGLSKRLQQGQVAAHHACRWRDNAFHRKGLRGRS